MVKKYCSGNVRLLSDILWCAFIAILLTLSSNDFQFLFLNGSIEEISDQVFSFLGRIIGSFFLFFFWSWRVDHIQKRFARLIIHSMCWIWFLLILFLMGLMVCSPKMLTSLSGWQMIGVGGIWTFFVFKKYIKLMWSEKSLSSS